MSGKNPFPTKSMLVAVVADESTVTGFLLTGIGQRGKNGEQNYMIVNKDTTDQQLEEQFGRLVARDDIGIILIGQSLAERVRSMIVEHQESETRILPTIMEIPSKDCPYDPTKDSMLVDAATKLFGAEAGIEKLKTHD
jgi:V-type H+-transporting ATPase subunit F